MTFGTNSGASVQEEAEVEVVGDQGAAFGLSEILAKESTTI